MNLMKYLFALLGACATLPVAAQTRRIVLDYQLWAEAQGELALKNGDYLLVSLYGQNTPAFNTVVNDRRFLGFDVRGAALAYEHFWNDRWSGGGTLQYISASGAEFVRPEVLLRHRSPLGPLTFGQRLGAYRIIPVRDLNAATGQSSNWLTLRADLEKLLPMGGGVALRPRLSYEAVARVQLKQPYGSAEERTINATSLRAEVGCRVNDYVDFTPWFAYTTTYFFTLGQFSSTGQSIGGGRLNLVTPVVGLDARLTLFQGKAAFERRQLPTQH